jgi:serine/threonine protein kinase
MPLNPGTHLGRYEIHSHLGAGGMGEVYRAFDPRLGRDVAIKILPAAFCTDAERLRRFEQEAQAAGSLNHPNILIIYDVDTHNGSPYVASELLEGVTLREQLSGGALSQRKAIDYAIQIAHGLAAAHDKGIIHRDVKPENLFVTKDGRVKILDFGLAKLREQDVTLEAQTDVPTKKINTDPGAVIGTVGYMSPEQVRGQRVDQRSDIFSFGCVFYEMLSGRRAFRGESSVETLNAILKEDPPDLSATNNQIFSALERVVTHCLEKNPDQRFRSAQDLAFAVEALSDTVSTSGTGIVRPLPPVRSTNRERVAWAAVIVVLLAALGYTIYYFLRPQTEAPAAVTRFVIPSPESAGFEGSPVISPDGRLLLINISDASGKTSFWLRALDSLDGRPLAGMEGGSLPFWSPDSRSIGFFAAGKLKKMDISGGPAQTLCDGGSNGAWSRDGIIIFSQNLWEGLYRIPAAGGVPAPATALDKSRNEIAHAWPYFLPDGRHFLYFARSAQREKSAIFVGSLDSNETKLLLNAESSMAYAPPGYLLFVREETLMAQPFDAERLELAGEAFPVAEQVGINMQNNARALFSVSQTGVLVYRNPSAIAWRNTQLAWFDRTGKQMGTVGESAPYANIHLSPDGKRVALQRYDTEKGTSDIWIIELARSTPSRLTFDPADDVAPVWSPDGSRIVFASNREGVRNLYQKLSSGGGTDELLLKSDQTKLPTDWSPDGRHLLFMNVGQKGVDLWVLLLFGDRKPVTFLQTDFPETGGRFSPDGRWIAYTSTESGKAEVYVRSFPASGGQLQVSNGGGTQPRWRRDGRELFYLSADEKLMAVEINGGGDTFEAGIPKPLFKPHASTVFRTGPHYDVTADGQRFLVNMRVIRVEENSVSKPEPVIVVTNWIAQLRQ